MDRMHHIGSKIKALSCALSQEMNRSTAALDLTGSQAFFLCYLASQQDAPVYPRDLEKEFDFTHPTVSGVLRRMESKGFITFRTGENDRRRKQILLTEKAVQCHEAMLQHVLSTEEAATRGLTPDECAELHRLLDKLIVNMGVLPNRQPPIEEEE